MKSWNSLLALLTALAATATAQVTFTFNGLADATAFGYTEGDTVTFALTAAAAFPAIGNSGFNATTSDWSIETTAHSPIWTAVTVTGVTGTYAEPSSDLNDPLSRLMVDASSVISFQLSADFTNIGLATPEGDPIRTLSTTGISLAGFVFDHPAMAVAPAEAFADFFDQSFTIASGSVRMAIDGDFATFTLTGASFAISGAAVPEPATYASWAGLGALALAVGRRRLRRRSER